jgi:hypothetical protein
MIEARLAPRAVHSGTGRLQSLTTARAETHHRSARCATLRGDLRLQRSTGRKLTEGHLSGPQRRTAIRSIWVLSTAVTVTRHVALLFGMR